MFQSATFKLTLWYVLLAASLCAIFSAVVYQLSTEELSEALHHQYNSFVGSDHDRDNLPPPHEAIQGHARHLLGELAWFNLVVIAGSSVFGYFLARRTLEPIEQAHQAQTRFTADASHELRTPLAAIRADTEVALMERGLSPTTKGTLQGNLRDIERLEQLTGRLLDIARYQSRATAESSLLDLDEIVQSVIKQFGHTVQEKRIRIKQNIKPVQVMGEQYGLRQLVAIALDNAIKYSHQHGTVTVSLRADKATATLTIKDKGIGIPANDLPHIFERFYRSANTVSGKETTSGYGLGLPLAQEIASAYHGTIDIRSNKNSGTTTHISLPIAPT
jgi:signal transduction histidine kinase